MRCTGTAHYSPRRNMTSGKAAVYGSCGAILVACLAGANMPAQDPGLAHPRAARAARSAGPDSIALDVRSQAARLHARMAQAPVPGANPRNPFAFAAARRVTRAADATIHAAVAEDAAVAFTPAPPALILMGVAEEASPSGPRRTAIIGGEADALYMVTEGQSVAGRYKVTKIGADAVELEDLTTKAYRRIAMR